MRHELAIRRRAEQPWTSRRRGSKLADTNPTDLAAPGPKAIAEILTNRHGHRLNTWITAVTADDQPDLHSSIAGLRRDHDAVLNGLTLPYSSGVVEGHVTRIRTIKRQMRGRADLDLLRMRLLLAGQGQSRSRKVGQIQPSVVVDTKIPPVPTEGPAVTAGLPST